MHSDERKVLYFDSNFIDFSDGEVDSIGSSNSFVPNRWKTIAWTSDA